MTPRQAIKRVFSKYASFGGRAGGTEFWWFMLFEAIVYGAAALADRALFGHDAVFSWTCTLVLLLPALAVSIRRLHDTNRSGWWVVLAFVPVLFIIPLIWFCTPSMSGSNRFGAMPGGISDEGVAVW